MNDSVKEERADAYILAHMKRVILICLTENVRKEMYFTAA